MTSELQHKFEQQMIDAKIVTDRKLFNKDSKGVYKYQEVFWMYRVWLHQEAKIETLLAKYKREVEESFMCGYTEAEYDFKYRVKEK